MMITFMITRCEKHISSYQPEGYLYCSFKFLAIYNNEKFALQNKNSSRQGKKIAQYKITSQTFAKEFQNFSQLAKCRAIWSHCLQHNCFAINLISFTSRSSYNFHQNWEVVVAQLVERSLLIPEVYSLNPVIGKFHIENSFSCLLSNVLKRRK